ncbi:MAG TPA: hypothetical protein VN089_20165 [Duganella sp.]|nr:hypothetical protein [Duganella sp.]
MRIELRAAFVTVATVERGWRRKAGKSQTISFSGSGNAGDWVPAIAALRSWMADHKPSVSDVELVLSDRYVRYLLVPWHDHIKTSAEIAALGRACFASAFGPVADGWDVQLDLSEYGAPGIACAIDRELLQELRTICSAHTLRLAVVVPAFMQVFNQRRAQLAGVALIAVVEEGRCVLASIRDGNWHSIRSLAANDIATLIEREILLQGLASDVPRHVHALDGAMEAAECAH